MRIFLNPTGAFFTRRIWIGILAVAVLLLALLVYVLVSAPLPVFYYVAFFWVICVIVLLWYGNRHIYSLLNERYPWSKYPSRRFFLQLLLSSLYSLLCINSTYYLFKTHFTGLPPDFAQVFVLNVYGLLFTIPVISINFGIYFMMEWKKAFIQSEELKKENIRSQFESLKNHIDPHFLFNSLNILSSLIEKDKEAAQSFLEHFSDVYRYVIQNKSAELVTLETELTFIQSYIYMLEKRFYHQLQIHIHVQEGLKNRYVPPLSLQMLLENAIKHNKASEKHPLVIEIYTDKQGDLVVKNNLQLKTMHTSGTQSGLQNIAKRYTYLSEQTLQIENSATHFIVRLPLLTLARA